MITKRYISSITDQINVHYYAKFLNSHDADKYFNIFEDKLKYNDKEKSIVKIHGKEHYIPRKQVAYGAPGTFYTFSGLKVEAISWNNKDDIVCRVIKNIKHKVETFTGKKFNFCLINRYEDGDQCIGYHHDDEKELGNEPTIVGVSLGAERDILFQADKIIPQNHDKTISLKLGHGSIFVMYHPTNKYWKHSIPRRANVTKPRISLTFRYLHV